MMELALQEDLREQTTKGPIPKETQERGFRAFAEVNVVSIDFDRFDDRFGELIV
jgi:hypothetical protein